MHCFLQDKVWKGLCAYSSPPCGNGSNTHFCRETGYVANTRFFRSFLLRFDSDKWDLTQTWLRYLDQKTAVGASGESFDPALQVAWTGRWQMVVVVVGSQGTRPSKTANDLFWNSLIPLVELLLFSIKIWNKPKNAKGCYLRQEIFTWL